MPIINLHQYPDKQDVDWVFLTKKQKRWRQFSPVLKENIMIAMKRVQSIRNDIASRSRVSTMPPIEIHDVCWRNPVHSSTIHGKMGFLYIGKHIYIGAQLTAPTILYASEEELTGIMLHEFSHCFYYCRQVVRCVALGIDHFNSGFENAFDEEDELSQLEKPEDWFSAEDCIKFPYWHSTMLEAFTEKVYREWIKRKLPIEVPNLTFSVPEVEIPQCIIENINQLENRKRLDKKEGQS